jgi:hypothetical protein
MVEEVIVEVKHYPVYLNEEYNVFKGEGKTERMMIPAWIDGRIDEDKVKFCVKSASSPNSVGNGYFAVAEYIDEQLKMAHRISGEWSFVMEVA